jgi:hypothetical protein
MKFTGKNLQLIAEALGRAISDNHNLRGNCSDVVLFEKELEALEKQSKRYQRLLDRCEENTVVERGEPNAYPLELTKNLHICLWSEDGTYKWTIALWHKGNEGYSLEFVGQRPLNDRVKWKKLKKIIKQGQAIADKRFAEQE